MAHTRSNFSDKTKATIFVRDHATCAFSGKSLWLLDYGLTPLWDYDWVDHIKPSARRGRAEIDNGICASYLFNSKKGANTRDSNYFFRSGVPTESFYDFFNVLPAHLGRQLLRLSRLHLSDWYFNRCLQNAFDGFDTKCRDERPRPTWGFRKSYAAAWNKLREYQRLSVGVPSMESRKLLLNPDRPDVIAVLRLRGIQEKGEFFELLSDIYPTYAANSKLHWDFWAAKSRVDLDRALRAAESSKVCSPLVLESIRSHHTFFTQRKTLPSQRDD